MSSCMSKGYAIHISCVCLPVTLSPSVIFGYLLKSPFGGEGWIVSVYNHEDIIGGVFLHDQIGLCSSYILCLIVAMLVGQFWKNGKFNLGQSFV